MAYKLAIFDFDGTLADSAEWVSGIFNEVAGRYRFRKVDRAGLERLRGLGNREILGSLGVPGWKLPMIARHVRARAARELHLIPLFEGVPAMIEALDEAGVEIAILTSNSEANVRRLLGADLAARIGAFECGSALFGKAQRVAKLLKRTGHRPGDVILIGDETRDIEAARIAGIASGAVHWGYAHADLLDRSGPTHSFATIGDLSRFLTGEGAAAA